MEKYTGWSSVLGPLLFLIYINDLPSGIESICKIFADDTSLFSKVEDATFSDTQLNNNLNKISKWAFHWKMLFNPDPSKQAIEICSPINAITKIILHWCLMTPRHKSLIARTFRIDLELQT